MIGRICRSFKEKYEKLVYGITGDPPNIEGSDWRPSGYRDILLRRYNCPRRQGSVLLLNGDIFEVGDIPLDEQHGPGQVDAFFLHIMPLLLAPRRLRQPRLHR